MIRTAIVLQARMGSRRLPGKTLADTAGQTVLTRCVERLQASSGMPVILATTTHPGDDCLQEAGDRLGVTVVRGAADDVLGRFVQVASTLGLTHLIRATCDNPAVDMDAPRRTMELLRRTGADHIVEYGLPHGAGVEAVTASALYRAAEWTSDAYDREHVTPFICRDGRFISLRAIAPGHLRQPGLSVTVDTPEDLAFVSRLFALAEATTPRQVELVDLLQAASRLHRDVEESDSGARGAR